MTTTKQSLNDIYAPIEKDLKEFSRILEAELASQDALISRIHAHLLKMTGKFLRPVLVLLSSRVENKTSVEPLRLAAAIELIHTATLVHDDIIDNSEFRRSQPSIYAKWGREISIISGDYLYAKAFMMLASLKNTLLNEAFAQCAHVICEGEMKQIEKRQNFLMSEEQYLKIIHQKTAALFQAASMGGAYYSGTSKANIEKLGDYGYRLGMAFQIVDDCLDIVGETESLGKTAGLDIYKNDVTLPLLYLFQSLDRVRGEKLLADMKSAREGLFEEVRSLCRETKAVDRAMAKAREYADEALRDLEGLKPTVYRESLKNLAIFCIERVH